MVRTVRHPTFGEMRLLAGPVAISGHDEGAIGPPPLLGEHTTEVLAQLGYGDAEIERLRAAEVI
jgi:crotonobetainyl-CoA:carnitine CoA-transferase CaiB-like acyl-CoA transferase